MRPPLDWESIETSYRAGVLSLRELGKQYSVSEGAIRKKAKAGGWKRDLTAKVQQQVRSELVRSEVRTESQRTESERETVEQAAAAIVQLVRGHRKDLTRGRSLVAKLMEQLDVAADSRDELEALIEVETEPPEGASKAAEQAMMAKRKAMLAAVSLPSHAGVLRDLANVLKSLIPLERQAFNVDTAPPEKPPEEQSDEVLDSLAERIAKFQQAQ